MIKLRIKKGDTVKVLSGKDKGKTGKVLSVIPGEGKLVVENVNLRTRFERSRNAGEKGKQVTFPSPMWAGKVMLLDPNSGNTTRVGFKFMDNGKKQRVAKKSNKAV